MPGVKPKSGQRPSREKGPEKGPRKPRPHGFSRQRMTPTHQVEHVLESCPECGADGLSYNVLCSPVSERHDGPVFLELHQPISPSVDSELLNPSAPLFKEFCVHGGK